MVVLCELREKRSVKRFLNYCLSFNLNCSYTFKCIIYVLDQGSVILFSSMYSKCEVYEYTICWVVQTINLLQYFAGLAMGMHFSGTFTYNHKQDHSPDSGICVGECNQATWKQLYSLSSI